MPLLREDQQWKVSQLHVDIPCVSSGVDSDCLQTLFSHYCIVRRPPLNMPFFYPAVPQSRALTPPDLSHLGPAKDSLHAPQWADYKYREETDQVHRDWYDPQKYAPKKFGHGPMVLSSMQSGYGMTTLDLHARFRNKDAQDSSYAAVSAPLSSMDAPSTSKITEGSYYHNAPAVHVPAPTASKEEKVIGGVAVHLDYEMDHMADFVAEMAQGMYGLYQSRICLADIDILRSVQFRAVVTPDFRKYVLQVLSSTRLPSSTILLGLHYLATRMSILPYNSDRSSKSLQLYHMLTTALLLGSKFLDDNTFQNRSWSEVSNIPVDELNRQEIEWLVDIKWDMHIRYEHSGFYAWLDKWNSWKAKKREPSLTSLKLSPLDTTIRQQRPANKPHPLSPIYPSHTDSHNGHLLNSQQQSYWLPSVPDWSTAYRRTTDYSPPSAPPTGPSTPEWYGLGNFGSRSQNNQAHSTRMMPVPVSTMPSHSAYCYPQYNNQYAADGWGGHQVGCRCGYCVPYHDRYPMMRGGMQTVAG